MPNVPLSLWSKWQIGHGKWFLNTNLFLIKPFLIKPFLITKFECTYIRSNWWLRFVWPFSEKLMKFVLYWCQKMILFLCIFVSRKYLFDFHTTVVWSIQNYFEIKTHLHINKQIILSHFMDKVQTSCLFWTCSFLFSISY